MGDTDWSDRMGAVWRWARRMVNGLPNGGVIRLADCGDRGVESERPAISIVLDQWPGRRVGDAVCADRLEPAAIRRLVAAVGDTGLSDPEWRVHGIEATPRGLARAARWLVGLAAASGGGEVVVDTATMEEQTRGELAAHLERLAPRADVAVKECNRRGRGER